MNRFTNHLVKFPIQIISKLYTLFAYLIPTKKNYFAFYPLHDLNKFSGNLKAMAEYITEYQKDVELIVMTTNEEVKKEAALLGIKTSAPFYGFSWALLRAEFIFIDSNWFPYLLSPKVSIIQLWHGPGFKNIALMDDNVSPEEKEKFKSYYENYALLITTSESDLEKNKQSFESPNIVITGLPRNDIFFSSTEILQEIKNKYHLNTYKKIITYAPTFRDFETKEPFSENFWNSLQSYLANTNQIFGVKKHPMDHYLKVPENLENIKDLSEIISDTQELLAISDVLISDYSSISTDFALTGKPILSYLYDFENYKNNCRSIYYDLNEILPKPFIEKEDDLLEKIIDLNWTRNPEYVESYANFKNTFHTYCDGNSSQRVMNEVFKLKK